MVFSEIYYHTRQMVNCSALETYRMRIALIDIPVNIDHVIVSYFCNTTAKLLHTVGILTVDKTIWNIHEIYND